MHMLPIDTQSCKETNTRDIFDVESCFENLKSNITDEFDCLKKSFFKEVNIFKNEILQPSAENIPDHYSERVISHLEEQIVFLRDELKEKDQLIHSLL